MALGTKDTYLKQTLEWALDRMTRAGYPIQSKVSLAIDPSLKFMGYAKEVGDTHIIVISSWALDSEMLGGLVLHELAHVYHSEKGSPTHNPAIVDKIIEDFARRDGLSEREVRALVDAFSHLQNIIVDDIVFKCMTEKESKLAARFFMEWISEQPTGDATVDATLLVRNAFAIASLKRRNIVETLHEMELKGKKFLSLLGEEWEKDFAELESFFINASPEWDEIEFSEVLEDYLTRIINLMSRRKGLEDLR